MFGKNAIHKVCARRENRSVPTFGPFAIGICICVYVHCKGLDVFL